MKSENIYFDDEIYKASIGEGIGSLYERLIVKKLFAKLAKNHRFSSVLEFKGLETTKGFDNITFLRMGKKVTLYVNNIPNNRLKWAYKLKPKFNKNPVDNKKYDLVWNFAVVQSDKSAVENMIRISDKYILIIVPNVINWGTPIHLLYHILTRTKCTHPEKGNIALRTLPGLKRYLSNFSVKIIESGYIDIPLIPDIGFSISELKKALGIKNEKKSKAANYEKLQKLFYKLGTIERLNISQNFKFPFAHHVYIFAKVI